MKAIPLALRYFPLALRSFRCYEITKTGVRFFTKLGFSVFVPKRIIKKLEGMV